MDVQSPRCGAIVSRVQSVVSASQRGDSLLMSEIDRVDENLLPVDRDLCDRNATLIPFCTRENFEPNPLIAVDDRERGSCDDLGRMSLKVLSSGVLNTVPVINRINRVNWIVRVIHVPEQPDIIVDFRHIPCPDSIRDSLPV